MVKFIHNDEKQPIKYSEWGMNKKGCREMSENFFTYKDRPLVRNKDTVYYGRMSDPYVVMMQIQSKKMDGDLEVADKISMQMLSTDLNVPPEKLVLKKSEKQGWFQALDVASSWLDRMDRNKT